MAESKTDKHWKRWAQQDPHHGVLGLGFDKSVIGDPTVSDLFFAQGEAHIQQVLDDAARVATLRGGAALDFGCGVGRLVRPLAERFDHVVGVDVSPDMLRLARENCPDEARVSLVETLDNPAVSSRRFDLVHSYIVLQHIRPVQGLPIIDRLIELTAPGGVVALHFTVGDVLPRRRRLNRLRYHLPPLHWAYNVRTGRAWNLPISEMNAYPLPELLDMVRGRLTEPMLMRSFDQGRHQGMMIIARKEG